MEKRTYKETVEEIKRLWKCEQNEIRQDDGFSSSISGIMLKIAGFEYNADSKNKFYGKVYREFKKLLKTQERTTSSQQKEEWHREQSYSVKLDKMSVHECGNAGAKLNQNNR